MQLLNPVASEVNKHFLLHIKDLRQLTLKSLVIKLLSWQPLNKISSDGNVRVDRAERRKNGLIPLQIHWLENNLLCEEKWGRQTGNNKLSGRSYREGRHGLWLKEDGERGVEFYLKIKEVFCYFVSNLSHHSLPWNGASTLSFLVILIRHADTL